ncbi:immunity 49 family protein [Saccharopolyspora flava]|uniref:Immunity protein 49 n=1 Tax=Saccharopolyspora flava TaxID=95161 RepID=A0A1I6TYK4_9PSEU|nr:immunity 49 family protein [Saccharopolyspora flava]SFS94260.1 Immunity protein 49 [Saccharopolyspora flava]
MSSTGRHATADAQTQLMADTFGTMIDEYRSNVGQLSTLAIDITRESLSRTGHLLLIDPAAEQESTFRNVLIAAQAGAAYFKAADTDAETIDVTVGTPISMAKFDPQAAGVKIADWLDSLWASVICRGQTLVSDLIHVPNETIRAGGAGFDEYMYAWADTLRAFFYRDDDVVEHINRSIELTHPDALRNATPEVALQRHYPTMKLLFNIAGNRPDQFNSDLQEAVDLHHQFWTATPERASDPAGFFALAPTALAALAHDRGFPVEVHSDYLPRNFIEPTWLSR